MAADESKNINDSGLQKVTDFTDALNRIYSSAEGSTKNGYIITKELIDYILTQAPAGDMLKSIYDTLDNGVVNDSRLINGDTVANDSAVAANTAKVSYTDAAAVALNTAKKTSLWQIVTNKLSNILQSVDYFSLFAKNVEVVRIGDGTNPKVIVDPTQTFGSNTGYWFGDGDTGFYESADDLVYFYSSGQNRFFWDTSGMHGSFSQAPSFINTNAGATTPNLIPRRSDNSTGLGSAAAGQLSVIAGGVEQIRNTATGTEIKVIKSGATQVAAGANPDEMWKTLGHATLPDNVIMHGV